MSGTQPPTSPSSGLLNTLKSQLQVEVEKIKADLGTVVTDVQTKIQQVDSGILTLTETGKQVMEALEKQKAESVTTIQAVIAEASSEFAKQRQAIETISNDVNVTKKEIVGMTTGLREELDMMRGQIQSLRAVSVGDTDAPAIVQPQLDEIKR